MSRAIRLLLFFLASHLFWQPAIAQDDSVEATETVSEVAPYIQNLRDAVQKVAVKEAESKDCSFALPIFENAIKDETQFAQLQQTSRRLVLYHLVECAVALEQYQLALQHISALVKLQEDKEFQLTRWFDLAIYLGDPEQGQLALARMVAIQPDLLSGIKRRDLFSHWRALEYTDTPEENRFELGKWFRDYTPPGGIYRPGTFDVDLAKGLIKQGQIKQAETVLLANPSAESIRNVHILNLYAPLREKPGFAKKFDLMEAYFSQLKWELEVMENQPKSLAAVLEVVGSYRFFGETAKALELAMTAWQKINNSDQAFDDVEDQRASLLFVLVRSQFDLGQFVEANTLLQILIDENPKNAWYPAYLAHFLMLADQPQKAIDLVMGLPKNTHSDLVEMAVQNTLACAHAQLGNRIEMDRSLSYLAGHHADNPAALTTALLCANRPDQTAASYIRRLRQPFAQQTTLFSLQNFQNMPIGTKWQQTIRQRRQQVIQRPDVQSAISKIGRIIDVPFSDSHWGDW
ncbi:hypothetical protein MNBD_ALPHA06-1842 [hydrothermal vent metagenome]|uniref:Uncharacterized protein n=1 Tax=hydrothermal vent metagenome TaxID=652676 RepID=A0A3B0RXD4_9ZZZZ